MTKKPANKLKKYINNIFKKPVVKISFFSFTSFGLIIGFYYIVFAGRIYPNVYLANIYLGGLTKTEAKDLLVSKIPVNKTLFLTKESDKFQLKLKDIDFSYDIDTSVNNAFLIDRDHFYSFLLGFYKKQNISLQIKYNKEKFNVFIFSLSDTLSKKGVSPSVFLKDGQIVVEKGIPGEFVDTDQITKDLTKNLSVLNFSDIPINIRFDNSILSQTQANNLYKRALKLLNKKLVVSFEDHQSIYSNNSLFALLDPFTGYNQDQINDLVDDESKTITRPPQNPIFNFSNGIVREFLPAKDGVTVDKKPFEQRVVSALKDLEESDKEQVSIQIPTINTPPDYKTEDVNSMGINQLIGSGKSKFIGSIASRIHNIALASSKFNGILVAPDNVFSFNKTLGEVSQETGYQQAYIIKEGSTILGDGGGVCQVSTTLFRAALNSGLPIVERQAHAYRVGYYEQDSPPGLDATVYEPSPDLKFKNDTPGHILIQSKVDTQAKSLIFEIYGTSDGRVSTISKPIVTNITPPPEDLYIDDPTLSIGQIKQIDWKAWGAKVWFDYKVTRNSEEIYSKRFYSNYRPWQAKFLRGTGSTQ